MFPAAVLGLATPALALTGTTLLLAPLTHQVVAAVGLALGAARLALVLLAQSAMGASWRIGVDESERTKLVTAGLFCWIRNPVFTGVAVVSAGVMLMVPTVIAALAMAALVAAVQIQVRIVEEPYLRRTHGRAYADYAATAGRFLPAVGRLPSTGSTPAGLPTVQQRVGLVAGGSGRIGLLVLSVGP